MFRRDDAFSVIHETDARAQFCKRGEWKALLARERYPNYREAPPQGTTAPACESSALGVENLRQRKGRA